MLHRHNGFKKRQSHSSRSKYIMETWTGEQNRTGGLGEGIALSFSCLQITTKLLHQRYLLLQPFIAKGLFIWAAALLLGKALNKQAKTELTCYKSIWSWLFFPPCWHKHSNILVASFQKPIYCQFDSSTRKYFFVTVAETHMKILYLDDFSITVSGAQ